MIYKKEGIKLIKALMRFIVNPLYSRSSISYTKKFSYRLVRWGILGKLESTFLNLPEKMPATNFIHTCGVSFLYTTDSNDDLEVRSRTSFADWEPATRSKFAELSKDKELIIDVGAYSGVYSLIAATTNPNTRVIAFEPNPSIFDQLKRNVAINSATNIELINVATGTNLGKSKLFLSSSSSSSSSLINNAVADSWIEIEVTTLDYILADIEPKSKCLMKIDVEGLESATLAGARNFIANNSPVIITEALDQKAIEEQELILSPLGYAKPKMISAAHPTDRINFLWELI